MATASLLTECQTLFEKGHESWKSFFSRWEVFAKYEEDLPESESLTEAKGIAKSSRQKKVKHQQTKPTVLSSFKCKKNQRKKVNQAKKAKRQSQQTKSVLVKSSRLCKYKKIQKNKNIKQKRALPESKQSINVIESNNPSNEHLVEDADNVQLETILKTVFTEIIKANRNEFQMFAVLSQTLSGGKLRNSHPSHQQTLTCYSFPKPLEPRLGYDTDMQICPYRSTYVGNLTTNSNFFKFSTNIPESEQIRYPVCRNSFHKFTIDCQIPLNAEQFFLPMNGNKTLIQTKLGIRNSSYPALLSSPRSENVKLKSLGWDMSLKSQNSVCGKINKEHFIKRSFYKMNTMEQDGKRFRDLCLRKRTNSVTLSMENSNFITPERKPPERKCFSENILQRKRRRPTNLFFGDVEEDSESDDQTEKQTPIIRCKSKKAKIQTIPEVLESDSDDCESIFDRVDGSHVKK